jgi:hypothetical protein
MTLCRRQRLSAADRGQHPDPGKPMVTTIVYSRYNDPALRVDVPK